MMHCDDRYKVLCVGCGAHARARARNGIGGKVNVKKKWADATPLKKHLGTSRGQTPRSPHVQTLRSTRGKEVVVLNFKYEKALYKHWG